jgi:dTDP-4-amino-4,6-dideoxygalactose transaminase
MDHIDVPFLDLVTPHLEMEEQLVAVFRNALHTAGFIGGKPVAAFEEAFANFCDSEHCVGVGSGTDALRFALIAAGVMPGDAVLTVANTFIATTEAITQAGAVPEFVDIDERTYNLDPEKLRQYLELHCDRDSGSGRAVSRRTGRVITAIVPVHLYGQMVDMDSILQLAADFNLIIVEDACQTHGAEYFSRQEQRWRKAGSIGKAAAFSFYPGKNLGACGEAGAVTTSDPEVAEICRKLRDHGQAAKYYHDIEGYNGRLDTIQAGLLHAKLEYVAGWNAKRREIASRYAEELKEVQGLTIPFEPPWSKAVYHLYVVRVPDRQEMQNALKAAGIGTGIHYPVPLHVQQAYQYLGYRNGDLPVTERVSEGILSLPMYPQLSEQQQSKVVEALKQILTHCNEAVALGSERQSA